MTEVGSSGDLLIILIRGDSSRAWRAINFLFGVWRAVKVFKGLESRHSLLGLGEPSVANGACERGMPTM